MKDTYVSANGCIDGMDVSNKKNYVPLTIAVYPAYAGNDDTAVELAEQLGLEVVTLDWSKVKIKNGVPNKIPGKIGSKKVTLKPTKKTNKPKGYENTAKTATAETVGYVSKVKFEKYVVADGNFAGNIYFD